MSNNNQNKIDLDKEIIEYFNNAIPLALLIEDFELTNLEVEYIYNKVKPVLELESEDNENKSSNLSFKTTEKIYKSYSIEELILFIRKIKRIAKKYNAKLDSKNISKKLNDIQNELISKNIDLIYECLNIFFHDIEMPTDDAIMFGISGLYEAITKYSYYGNSKFKTFAIKYIIYNIKKHFYELTGMSWNVFRNKRHINNNIISEDYSEDLSDDRYDLPMTLEDYKEIDELEDKKLSKYAKSNIDVEDTKILVKDILNKLSSQERQLIEKYYGLNGEKEMFYREISVECGLPIPSVQRAKDKAEEHFKNHIFAESNPNKNDEANQSEMNDSINLYNPEMDYKYRYICQLIIAGINFDHLIIFLTMNNISCTEDEIMKIVLNIKDLVKLINTYGYNLFYIRQELNAKEIFISKELIDYININSKCLNSRIRKYFRNSSNNKKMQKLPL